MLKVFHFKTNRVHWMYKQVFTRDGFFVAKHYPFGKNYGYDLQCMADSRGVLLNHEVIYEDLKFIRGKPMICFYERLGE